MKRLLPRILQTSAFLAIAGLQSYNIYQDNQTKEAIDKWKLSTNANLATLAQLQTTRYADMDQRLLNSEQNLQQVYEATQQAFGEVNERITANAKQSRALAQQAANTAQNQEQIIAQLQGFGQSLQNLNTRYQQVLQEQAEQINAIGNGLNAVGSNQQEIAQRSAALYQEAQQIYDQMGLLQSQIAQVMQYARQNELRIQQVQQIQEEAIIPTLIEQSNGRQPHRPVEVIRTTTSEPRRKQHPK